MPQNLRAMVGGHNKAAGLPVVFLHGFGGVAEQWELLQSALSLHAPTLSFDLPGHGASVDCPGAGSPKQSAEVILEELQRRGMERCHFVGHSMGGAIASLIGLMAPQRTASLCLLAPGGFGPEINFSVLKDWAEARTRAELQAVMPMFVGSQAQVQSAEIGIQMDVRQRPGVVDRLITIMESMSQRGTQGTLPLDDLAAAAYPVSLIWGDEDQILPVSQAQAMVGKMDVQIIKGMGHTPMVEAPSTVFNCIVDRVRNLR